MGGEELTCKNVHDAQWCHQHKNWWVGGKGRPTKNFQPQKLENNIFEVHENFMFKKICLAKYPKPPLPCSATTDNADFSSSPPPHLPSSRHHE